MSESTTEDSHPPYSANERVLCEHAGGLYSAKILDVKYFEPQSPESFEGIRYYIHYQGWKDSKWNEWVPASRLQKADSEDADTIRRRPKKKKPIVSKRPYHRKDGPRGTKRRREDDEGKVGMKLVVPEELKQILLADRDMVVDKNFRVTLERIPNVDTVLKEFAEHVRTTKPPSLKEPTIVVQTVVDGIQCYFDRAIGSNLLYDPERRQYAFMREKYWTGRNVVIGTEKEMSFVYGAEHLLRLLVLMPQFVAATPLDLDSKNIIRDYTNELLRYMAAHKDRIFLKEYIPNFY